MDQVKGKTDRAIQRGRQAVLERYIGGDDVKGKFADPAMMFARPTEQ